MVHQRFCLHFSLAPHIRIPVVATAMESSDARTALFAVYMRQQPQYKSYHLPPPPPAAGQPSRRLKSSSHRRSTKDVLGKQAFLKDRPHHQPKDGRAMRCPLVNHSEPPLRSSKTPRDNLPHRSNTQRKATNHRTHDSEANFPLPCTTPSPLLTVASFDTRPLRTPSPTSSERMPSLSPPGWFVDSDDESEVTSLDDWSPDKAEVVEVATSIDCDEMFQLYINVDLCLNE